MVCPRVNFTSTFFNLVEMSEINAADESLLSSYSMQPLIMESLKL
jgi:hypothetical protein